MRYSQSFKKIKLENKADQAVLDRQEIIKSNIESLNINIDGISNESLP